MKNHLDVSTRSSTSLQKNERRFGHVTTEGIRDSGRRPIHAGRLGSRRTGQFLYAYRIVITNVGTKPARLKARHWVILDATHHREDVHGEGVVGKTPRLAPGESFAYTSGCPLRSEWGTMEGSFLMERDDGRTFHAEIGRFLLTPTAPRLSSLKR